MDEVAIRRALESGESQIKLRWKRIQDSGAVKLAGLFEEIQTKGWNHKIEEIDLSGCDIDNAGVASLLQVLSQDGRVSVLNLSCNSFGEEGMRSVAEMLKVNR